MIPMCDYSIKVTIYEMAHILIDRGWSSSQIDKIRASFKLSTSSAKELCYIMSQIELDE